MIQKKIAIFVEGQTERMFMSKLLQEIAGYKNITLEVYKVEGDRNNRRITRLTPSISKTLDTTSFFAILYDCGSESHVVSDIKNQYVSLCKSNYEKIIGIRDLFPKELNDQDLLDKSIRANIKSYLKRLLIQDKSAKMIDINIILAVMEIEAWFLAEWTHFVRINKCLTTDFIFENLDLDLMNIEVEQIKHPSQDLNNIYQLIGCNYDKKGKQVTHIVENLDYELIYLTLPSKIKQLQKLVDEINSFFSLKSDFI